MWIYNEESNLVFNLNDAFAFDLMVRADHKEVYIIAYLKVNEDDEHKFSKPKQLLIKTLKTIDEAKDYLDWINKLLLGKKDKKS